MRKPKPVFVEIEMNTSMDALWERTQSPSIHERWDLRFSEIRYLPKDAPDSPQRFIYSTRIGFGLRIEGIGETITPSNRTTSKEEEGELPQDTEAALESATGTKQEVAGQRISVLRFRSDNPISLIREGGGFWRYVQHGERITFTTVYNYRTRFGLLGRAADTFVFRPLMGWATAWSFDRLRIWLEDGIPPGISLSRWLVHTGGALLLAMLWMYQGIVPKLLVPEAGELDLLRAVGWFPAEWERGMLIGLGAAETAFGMLLLGRSKSKRLHKFAAVVLVLLAVPPLLTIPQLWAAPLNPIVVNGAMIGLHGAVAGTSSCLPTARRCRRRERSGARKEHLDAVDL